jgi:eukaryotic-like serine/threonine-protein kinase
MRARHDAGDEARALLAIPGSGSSTDPAHEIQSDGRTALQSRLTTYALVMLVIYLSYWPAFYLIWSRDPAVGSAAAIAHVTHPSAGVLGVIHLGFWLCCRARIWPVSVLVVIDVIAVSAIGAAFAAIVLDHPSPIIAVLEGLLALTSVLSIRALLVPSSLGRTALAGVLTCAPTAAMLLAQRAHFASSIIAFPTLVFLFANWSAIVVVFTAFASSVLYGLRREVREAQRFGQYTLLEKLGEGGMGVVYRARHALLRRPTAIKLLNATHQLTSLPRFEQEVQSMAELVHPNTVTVHDYGRTADGVFYYAMEFLDGVDLHSLVDVDGPQHPARVIHLLRQACGALGEAHRRGLIHRDVKPANVFLCREHGVPDAVKVLDFGLVKDLSQDSDTGTTGSRSIIGTPLYMSPESIANPGAIDARSDLYSLGAVGYLLLCGQAVYSGETMVEICAQHLHAAPVAPSVRVGRPIPADLEAVILRCLEKSPSARPADADELSALLSACADAEGWSASRARSWWTENEARIRTRRTAQATTASRWSRAQHQTVAIDPEERLK